MNSIPRHCLDEPDLRLLPALQSALTPALKSAPTPPALAAPSDPNTTATATVMSTDPSFFSLLDDFDDFPFNPSLRIPPLQDPLPFIPSSRPSPLEPNARVNDGTHNATAKLTSRRKALAKAKLIGESDHPPPYEVAPTDPSGLRVHVPEPSKKQKLGDATRPNDFVQLPKPVAKARTRKPQPFQRVPVLNGLHEPPPSAALFPPITTEIPRGDDTLPRIDPWLFRELTAYQRDEEEDEDDSMVQEAQSTSPPDEQVQVPFEPVKRATLRPRLKWTEEETQDLLRGVKIYGPGKWKRILNAPALTFAAERTTVDLKDRYRTCRMNQERDVVRQQYLARQQLFIRQQYFGRLNPMLGGSYDDLTGERPEYDHDFNRGSPLSTQLPSLKLLTSGFTSPFGAPPLAVPGHNSAFAPANPAEQWLPPTRTRRGKEREPKSPPPYRPHRTLPPRWSKAEDENLARGYQQHGFRWTHIAKDPDINLTHRTGSQVRDRFRLKFSELYQAVPPHPDPKFRKRPRKAKGPKSKVTGNGTAETDSETTPDSRKQTASPSSGDLTLEPSKDSRANPPSSPNTMPLWTQSIATGSPPVPKPYLSVSPGSERKRQQQMEPSSDVHHSALDATSSSDERSRHSSAAGDEGRHMGIMELLNEEEDEGSRLPAFRYPYEDWGGGSITLPPLLWEDMATRPIFDLEE